MKIHEYQAKEIFREAGLPVPRGFPCFSVSEALDAAKKIGGDSWVVKAQIHAGGRGKGGGVKLARSLAEVERLSGQILGMTLVTAQTGSEGKLVKRLLVEEGAGIEKEFYCSMVVDRISQRVVMISSPEGGTEIEVVAKRTPEKIQKTFIDPGAGLTDEQALSAARKMGVPDDAVESAKKCFQALYRVFVEKDAMLAEINPLILTRDHRMVALDAKINFDDNALYRHPEILSLRDMDEEDPAEMEASKFGLSYISLDGDIGCLVNGAGLAMATMDIVKLFGAMPANFLDVGGGATVEKVTEAFKLMLENPKVKVILVNIFGGIMKCDVIAQGIIEAARQVRLSVPLVVRLEGTNVDLGKKILAESKLPIISAVSMMDAAQKAVQARGI